MISNKISPLLGCSLAILLVGCGSDNKTVATETTHVTKESTTQLVEDTVKQEVAVIEEVQETPNTAEERAVPQISDKDRLENEKFRLAELERRRQLAMQANPGLVLPKPKPANISSQESKTEAAKKTDTQKNTPATKQKTTKIAEPTTQAVKEKIVSTPTSTKAVDSSPSVVKADPTPAKAVSKPSNTGKAEITFDQKTFAFDTIVEGDIINHKFRFVNTGERPIEILNAKASCGCTMPSFPFLTIEPGDEGFIGVTYNSRTKEGKQTPEIEVITNYQDEPLMLYLDGYVKEKDQVKSDKEIEDQGK